MDNSIQNVADPETESIWKIEVKRNYFRLWCNNKLSFYKEYRNISSDCENRMKTEPVMIMLVGKYDKSTLRYQVAPGNDCPCYILVPKPISIYLSNILIPTPIGIYLSNTLIPKPRYLS